VVSRWTDEGKNATAVRMLRSRRHKYIYYADERVELLYDLDNDPGEMRNLAALPEHGEILVRHRTLLKQYCHDTHDPFPAI
jgi:choline-sulfatase